MNEHHQPFEEIRLINGTERSKNFGQQENLGTVTGLFGTGVNLSKGTGPRDSSVREPAIKLQSMTISLKSTKMVVIRFRGSTRTLEDVHTLPLCLLPGSTKRRPCETGYCGRADLFCYPDPTAGAG